MSEPIIKIEGLSKRHRIGRREANYKTLRDAVSRAALAPFRRLRSAFRRDEGTQEGTDFIWALRDVSVDIERGEVVGIIGRNGAGKTTLLKVLSRITWPTAGCVTLNGRVASLLEVGTGFHHELTGRENIYLNGAILGMTKREIDHKFDEIVAFAEIERFLDTPVKRYSSGMYVRLAFAVAAHLEPEILLVDEVLAVGDAAFQKKCLGKMGEVAKQGRTVLFVSHSMPSIMALCESGLYLSNGRVALAGGISDCVNAYLGGDEAARTGAYAELPDDGSQPVQLLSAGVVDAEGHFVSRHPYDKPFWLRIRVRVRSRVSRFYLAAHIHESDLQTLLFTRDFEAEEAGLVERQPGLYEYAIKIPAPLLVPGTYRISAHVADEAAGESVGRLDHVCPFEIVDTGSTRARAGYGWRGKISVPLKWECIRMMPLDQRESG